MLKEKHMKIDAIDHLVINVTDVERSARWYVDVLGMRRLEYGDNPKNPRTAMLFGSQRINLRPVDVTKSEWVTADHETAGSDDICFLTTSSPDEVLVHLKTCGVEVISGPIKRSGARGEIVSTGVV